MARRTIDIKIEEAGRDQGKLFKITEMSAFDTESWAIRSINAILRNSQMVDYSVIFPLVYSYVGGINQIGTGSEEDVLPELSKGLEEGRYKLDNPLQALALYFANSFFVLPYDELIKVSDPLLKCCSIYLDPAGNKEATEPVLNNLTLYIEEPSTLMALKREVFKLHTDFFIKAMLPYLNANKPVSAQP